jgi:hypothetical protein
VKLDPSAIDARLVEAINRDNACSEALKVQLARLPVCMEDWPAQQFSLDALTVQLRPGRMSLTGKPPQLAGMGVEPEDGSYAAQLWSAICFMVDARVELKLLDLIRSPDFYSALMRSAAEVKLGE